MRKTAAHLGQHFLRSQAAVTALADAARLTRESIALEIGPGEGVLTEALLSRAGRVIAIEKDSALAEGLRTRFASEIADGRLLLIEDDFRNINIKSVLERATIRKTDDADCLKGADSASAIREGTESPESRTDLYGDRSDDGSDKKEARCALGSYVVAANIPYYITGEIIRTLLTAPHQPERIVLLIQKEVAERVCAKDGKESILSLSVKAYGRPSIVKIVPRGSFSPMPQVDSAILSIETISRDFFSGFSEAAFFAIVHAAFAAKRKQLAGNLRAIADAEDVSAAMSSCGAMPKARAEDVPLEKWACLASMLVAKSA